MRSSSGRRRGASGRLPRVLQQLHPGGSASGVADARCLRRRTAGCDDWASERGGMMEGACVVR